VSRLSGQVSFVSLCFLLLGPSVAHVVFRGSIWRSDHKNNEPGLLFFSIPFSETEQGVAQAIIRSVLDFRRDPWPKVSENAKDLIRKMLDPDQKRRLTAQQVLGTDLYDAICLYGIWDRQRVLIGLCFIFLRSPVVTECKDSPQCIIGWNSEGKVEAVHRHEQAQETSTQGKIHITYKLSENVYLFWSKKPNNSFVWSCYVISIGYCWAFIRWRSFRYKRRVPNNGHKPKRED